MHVNWKLNRRVLNKIQEKPPKKLETPFRTKMKQNLEQSKLQLERMNDDGNLSNVQSKSKSWGKICKVHLQLLE